MTDRAAHVTVVVSDAPAAAHAAVERSSQQDGLADAARRVEHLRLTERLRRHVVD